MPEEVNPFQHVSNDCAAEDYNATCPACAIERENSKDPNPKEAGHSHDDSHRFYANCLGCLRRQAIREQSNPVEIRKWDRELEHPVHGERAEKAVEMLKQANEDSGKTDYRGRRLPLSELLDQTRLDPADPIDAVLEKMVATNRAKRRDYAADSDIFSNFRDVADMFGHPGITAVDVAYILLLVKVARLSSLRKNGRMEDPSNESVLDTYLDLSVYSVIVQALLKEKQDGVE